MGTLKDLTGQKFGYLTVVKTFRKNKRTYCECICKCGNKIVTRKDALVNSRTISCGCLHKEKSRIIARKIFTTHGLRHSRLYGIWCGIKKRCLNTNCKSYKDYGGRGITICDEWKKDFKTFYDWSMANGYQEILSIDRIDVNGNYEPSNCRWSDKKTQNRNTTQNKNITYNGETHCLSEWAEILNIPPKTLFTRLRRGWTIDNVLTYKKEE